jgi:predicted metal-dependent phosphoesterase TrpH
VNEFVERASEGLKGRGHQVTVLGAGDPVKKLLGSTRFDIVHVHEPFAPSISSAALRHSHSLNVATFHAPQERVLSTQVARPLVEIFFGRLDARTVTTPATAKLLEGYFPGSYELIEPGGASRDWAEVAAALEALYRRLTARRHDPDGNPEVRRRVAGRELIEVDLHMHTDHSPDCATPVDVLLKTARDRGLGAIAITDHNEVSGALEARRIAEEMGGIEVIVAEEVKTAEQGEVIGLFLEEKIPRGMTMAETIAEIRRQGGLVYVPHPFDRFHSVPDYEHLLDMVEEIDILEVFNPRVALTAFNEEAERFAGKYRIVPGAGSDSHVAQGLGSVRVRIHDFDGPEEFLEAMRDADITRKHKNLVYVQALKLLQTTGRPKAPKRRVPNAKPVRGGKPRGLR